MIKSRYDVVFFRQTAPAAMLGHVGADSLKKTSSYLNLISNLVRFFFNHRFKLIEMNTHDPNGIHVPI